ncbi:cyclic AMP-dependent transcription factor ATF-6 alpha isoform X2 [Adelges cooleyi]|uniref:cyclic AMP-dependent transcription factor ATF-6 alpha isoform X2 n=1 Tax=Adelges cooleyi TaxID=133065 RepID=UPI00217F5F75|nr:cyclic AMP-dependent transcription factor ATF-6 alpha isoform X2 [Adelges cooleyi]
MPNKNVFNCLNYASSETMDFLVEPKNELFGFNELKMESLSPTFDDEVKFYSEVSDLDNDLAMQWSIETCFGNGIELEKNDFSPPSSPSSNGSMPSVDSLSSCESNQVLSNSSSPNAHKEFELNTSKVIAPKPIELNQQFRKLNFIPTPDKLTPDKIISSRTGTLIHNNFNVSSMLTNQSVQRPIKISRTPTSSVSQKIMLTPDQFSKITKMHKEIKVQPESAIPTAPLVTSTSDISSRLSIPRVDLTTTRSHSPTTLQYNQINAIKRHQRMIRNREAASLSRKKKKEYVTSLEEKVNMLQKENLELKIENSSLKERLKIFDKLSMITDRPLIKKAKKATAILSVVLVISFNIIPLGLFNSRQSDNSGISMNQLRNNKPKSIDKFNYHSRNILWVSDFEDTNSSWNSTEHLMCPMYINVSESKRIDSELRKWIEPRNINLDKDDITVVQIDSNMLNSNTKNINQNKTVKSKDKKKEKSHNPNLKKQRDSLFKNSFIEMFGQLKFDAKESLFDSIERQEDTFYVVSFSGDHLLLPASHNVSNTTHRPKMSLVFPALTSNGSDFVTMIQIDCAVTDTKTLHLRDTHLRNNNDLRNNASHPKQNNIRRTSMAHRPYFLRQTYSGTMFGKINNRLPSY